MCLRLKEVDSRLREPHLSSAKVVLITAACAAVLLPFCISDLLYIMTLVGMIVRQADVYMYNVHRLQICASHLRRLPLGLLLALVSPCQWWIATRQAMAQKSQHQELGG